MRAFRRVAIVLGVALVMSGVVLWMWVPEESIPPADELGPVGVSPTIRSEHPSINKASFDRIKNGMSEDEVVAVLGCEPGNYATRHLTGTMTYEGYSDFFLAGMRIREWASDSVIIRVAIACPTGTVCWKRILPAK